MMQVLSIKIFKGKGRVSNNENW